MSKNGLADSMPAGPVVSDPQTPLVWLQLSIRAAASYWLASLFLHRQPPTTTLCQVEASQS
jgi:hypothetical protein